MMSGLLYLYTVILMLYPLNSTDTCPDDDFQCNDGTCISIQSRCDGYTDCPEGSDEQNCQNCKLSGMI